MEENATAVTAATFDPIIKAITGSVNVTLLASIVAKVLPFAVGFFVFYWGYGFVTSKISRGAKKGKM